MAYTPKVLVSQQYVENAATLKYTSPATVDGGKGTWIDKATFANPTAGSATVTVYIVPSGGAVSDATKAIPPVSIAAGATLSISDLAGKFIAASSAIHWVASSASTINGAINGREVT
jgi:hypothetical protein